MGPQARRVRRVTVAIFTTLAFAAPAQAATGVSYRATFSPREALFGDPIAARVDVVVDPHVVDPAGVRVHVDFRPYSAAPPRVTRRRVAGLARVEFVYRLECLVRRCLPKGPDRTFVFAPVRITAGNRTETFFWPHLHVSSRVDPRDLARPTPRSDVVRQPPVTWRVKPDAAVAVLVGAALLLLAYPALLVVRASRRRWRLWRASRLERLTPLERALELLRRAAGAGDERSRLALERVARELGGHALGDDARRLAWSRPQPDAESMDTLRTEVEDRR